MKTLTCFSGYKAMTPSRWKAKAVEWFVDGSHHGGSQRWNYVYKQIGIATWSTPNYFEGSLSGRVKYGTKPGPRPYLNNQEECALADYLIKAAKIGYGKTRKEVKSIAERVTEEKHCLHGTQVTDGWWTKFLQKRASVILMTWWCYSPCPYGFYQ